jgi:purine-binding chemotaxis protein CheW
MERVKNDRARAAAETRQYIGFRVGGEEYGIELLRVREVIRPREITRLPRTPSFVRGIINLRGDVIPVFDLRDKFSLPAKADDEDTRVIVTDLEGRLVGMVVDAASQVVRIPAADIEPAPPVLGGFRQEHLHGIGKLGDRLVILLNVDRILSSEERIALAAAGEAAPEPGAAAR